MNTFLTAALIIVPAIVLMFSAYNTFKKRMEGQSVRKVMRVNVMTFLVLIILVSICAFAVSAANDTVAAPAETPEVIATAEEAPAADSGNSKGLGLLAAALVTAISGIGGGIAVASSASAALGAISENEGAFGKALIFVGLAEGVALYGLIVALLLLFMA